MSASQGKALAGVPGTHRRLWAVLTLLAAAAGLLGWWLWSRHPGPAVPEVPLVSVPENEPMVKRLVEEMREKVLREPGSARAWGRLGEVLIANGYDQPGLSCLEEAERLDPASPRWPYLRAWRLLLLDRDRGIPPLRCAVELCRQEGDSSSAPRLTLVDALLEKGELAEAEQHLQQVLAREPENPHAQFDRGLLALQSEDLAGAERSFHSIIDSPYARKKARVQLAAVCQRRGQAAEAAELARKASELPEDQSWPDPYLEESEQWAVSREARYKQADLMERQGRIGNELRLLAQLAEDFPGEHSQAALGVALAKVGEYDRAEEPLRTAIRLAPDKAVNYLDLSVVLLRQGENLRRQGNDQLARARFREAADWAQKAAQRKADHAMAHYYRGLALVDLGQRTEAITSFSRAIQCEPNLMEAHLHLGEVLAEEGQTSRARAALQAAADLAGKDDDRPRTALERLQAREKRHQ